MRILILLTSLLLVFSACQSDTKSGTDKEETATTAETKSTTSATTKYKLTPFSASQAYTDAKIENFELKDGKFDFTIADGSYKLGVQTPDAPQKNCANSGKGQHIHLLIDDKPYAARYTSSFDDVEISDGQHYMLAFLSRSYHESIKTKDARVALVMNVQNQSIRKSNVLNEAMIWYSRPKGTYKGKANTDKVMLDFYVLNTVIQEGGNQVKADINGEIHMLKSWNPYYIEGLPMGKNKITLSLVDREGNLIIAPQNPISREFTLEVDPTE